MRKIIFLVVAIFALLALVPQAGASVSTSAAKKCGQVDVKSGPDAEGSAVDIRATNLGCREARKIARRCLKGSTRSGWTAKLKSDRLILKSGERKVTFMPAGGGGCTS